ncbi:MAG: hypothetical protein WC711_03985 [Candidatus Staskawiczbacteria bacterium]|jgi:hypothetical protein
MTCNIKSTEEEQYKAEKKRFTNRMKPKPVLAEKIKRREERQHKKDGSEKINLEDLN